VTVESVKSHYVAGLTVLDYSRVVLSVRG